MASFTVTEIAAWWGATVATTVFFWDIYKWRQSGARVRLSVSPNMEPYGVIANWLNPNQALVAMEVVNIGSKRTTITHVFAYYYVNWWARIRGKRTRTLVVQQPIGTQPLPFALEPGARWLGGMEQNQELEEMSRSGHLLVGIHHSVAKNAVLIRLVVPVEA